MCVYNERIKAAQEVINISFPDSLLKCKRTCIPKLFKELWTDTKTSVACKEQKNWKKENGINSTDLKKKKIITMTLKAKGILAISSDFFFPCSFFLNLSSNYLSKGRAEGREFWARLTEKLKQRIHILFSSERSLLVIQSLQAICCHNIDFCLKTANTATHLQHMV